MIIGDCPVLVPNTLTIREAFRTAIQMNMDNIFVESDYQVALAPSWTGLLPQNRFVLVEDFNSIARKLKIYLLLIAVHLSIL